MTNKKTLVLVLDEDPVVANRVGFAIRKLANDINVGAGALITVRDTVFEPASLLQVMLEYKPNFLDAEINKLATVVKLNAVRELNEYIIEASLADSAARRQFNLDQALRLVNGDKYRAVLEAEKQKQLEEGSIDLPEEFRWSVGSPSGVF